MEKDDRASSHRHLHGLDHANLLVHDGGGVSGLKEKTMSAFVHLGTTTMTMTLFRAIRSAQRVQREGSG